MKNNKIIFIPGLSERAKNYRSFSKYMTIHDIDWNNIKLPKKEYATVVGFSIGADFACEYSLKHKVKTLILCSLMTGSETLKSVKADKVIFLVGEKEKWCLQDIKRTSKTLRCAYEIHIIPKAIHKITGNYRKKLLEVVSGIA